LIINLGFKISCLAICILLTDHFESKAQNDLTGEESSFLLVLNKNNEPLERIHIGDRVKIRQVSGEITKGEIITLNTDQIVVNSLSIPLHQVKKIRKFKDRKANLIIGGILVVGGIATYLYLSRGETDLDDIPLWFALGTGLTAGGVALMVPTGIRISPSRKIMVISKP
jgi:uncharacterized protein (UPF0248 family)